MEEKQRTLQQNKSLHKMFDLLANELNQVGWDMRRTLKESVDIPWSAATVKQYLWRPVQEAQLGKESTTELTTKEIQLVYETLNRFLGEKLSVHVPWPSSEDILIEKRTK